MKNEPQKIIIWMNMPSHHQSDFFYELSLIVNLNIYYTGKQDTRRKSLGWKTPKLESYEQYSLNFVSSLFFLFRNKNALHVITGCGNLTNIMIWLMCRFFKIQWCHLSEEVPVNINRIHVKQLIINKYYTSINNSAKCAFAIGNKAKRSFEYLGVKSKLIYITNYSSSSKDVITSNKLPEKPIRAIVLGQISYDKGTDILLDVMDYFATNLLVDFFGSVSKENSHFLNRINKLKNTKYLGVIPSNKVKQLWSGYHLLIFPSRMDGWGMAVHEAISHNVPVICSNEAGCSEHLVINGYNGFIIDPEKHSLIDALEHYINQPSLLTIHANNNSTHKNIFSPKETALKFHKNLIKKIH